MFLACCTGVRAGAQTLDNKVLTGKYFFREILLTSDTSGLLTDARSVLGTLTFNAAGQYTFTGRQALGVSAPTAVNGTGTYTVAPNGTVSLTDPLRNTASINGRYGTEALIGSSTETTDNSFNLLIAIPAPTAAQSNASLNGSYNVATLEFPSATAASIKNALSVLQLNGSGGLGSTRILGHAANVANGAPATQSLAGGTYTVAADGSGMALFGNTAPLLTGTRNIYISRNGNVFLGASPTAGTQDLLIGVKSAAAGASNASWHDLFWTAGLRIDNAGGTAGYTGSLNAIPTLSRLSLTRRLHQAGVPTALDFTGVNSYTINSTGTGSAELTQVGLGASGDLFLTAGVNALDPGGFELNFGIRAPTISGTGLFLNPDGIVNGASLAPAGNAIAPGEFISLFSVDIGPKTVVPAKPPYPKTLGGVTVTVNGNAAPLHFAGPNQINLLVPYATTGSKATIVVNNNGAISNAVDVPLASTAPGIFSLDQSGTGSGAVLHADFTLVDAVNPARRGETVLIFLTGLGTVSPGVADGTAGGSNPLSPADAVINVLIGGKPASIVFAGLAPGFPGLYQINATVPIGVAATGRVPLAIATPDAYHDQVDLLIQ